MGKPFREEHAARAAPSARSARRSPPPTAPSQRQDEAGEGTGRVFGLTKEENVELIIGRRHYCIIPVEAVSAPEEPVRDPACETGSLTAREFQIVVLVADGRVNKQFAAELHISEWTVSTHLRRIFAKLKVDTRAAMVSRCADSVASRQVAARR